MAAPTPQPLRFDRRYLALVAILAAALYVLIPQVGDFHASWHLLGHPAAGWTAAAIALTALTYGLAAGTYCLLAFKPLGYAPTVLVQLAAMFVNRLLPGGIGALGANYAYLRHRSHSPAQAATVPAVNNLLGVAGHGLVVAAVLAARSGRLPAVSGPGTHAVRTVVAVLAVGAVVILLAGLAAGRRRFAKLAAELRQQLFSYRRRPWRLLGALVTSVLLTLSNVLSLACCALAIGVHLPFTLVLLIFTLGIGTGTATPTPGGLGGFEAGLTAGFVAYQVPGAGALAIALLYRLISYWLPLLAGAPALVASQKQRLFTA